MLVPCSVIVAPDVARRAADAITGHLRRSATHDVGLAQLVVDLSALACRADATPDVTPAAPRLTVAEYARLVGVTDGAVRQRIKRGRVKARKEHGQWRVTA